MKTRKLLLVLVVVASLVCHVWAAESSWKWKYVGRQAYTGTPEQAIKKLSSSFGLSASVENSLLEAVKYKKSTEVVIKRGDEFDAMVFGSGEVRTNVVAAWEDGVSELKAEKWTVFIDNKECVLIRPLTCNNLSIIVRPVVKQSIQPISAPSIQPVEPRQWAVIIINLWSFDLSSPEGKDVLRRLASGVPNHQSRDLGHKIKELAAEGKIVRNPDCFDFVIQFHDADTSQVQGAEISVNGQVQILTTNSLKGIKVQSCGKNGGYLATPIRPKWNTEKISATIFSPFPSLPYPKSGVLRTCGPATINKCGGTYDQNKPTKLYIQLREEGAVDYHFVK